MLPDASLRHQEALDCAKGQKEEAKFPFCQSSFDRVVNLSWLGNNQLMYGKACSQCRPSALKREGFRRWMSRTCFASRPCIARLPTSKRLHFQSASDPPQSQHTISNAMSYMEAQVSLLVNHDGLEPWILNAQIK